MMTLLTLLLVLDFATFFHLTPSLSKCFFTSFLRFEKVLSRMHEVLRMIGCLFLKSFGFFLHTFLDFPDRCRFILILGKGWVNREKDGRREKVGSIVKKMEEGKRLGQS